VKNYTEAGKVIFLNGMIKMVDEKFSKCSVKKENLFDPQAGGEFIFF